MAAVVPAAPPCLPGAAFARFGSPAMSSTAVPDACCLAVSGLPRDATKREVYILFSGCPGFLRCFLDPVEVRAVVQFEAAVDAECAAAARCGSRWGEGTPPVQINVACGSADRVADSASTVAAATAAPRRQAPGQDSPMARNDFGALATFREAAERPVAHNAIAAANAGLAADAPLPSPPCAAEAASVVQVLGPSPCRSPSGSPSRSPAPAATRVGHKTCKRLLVGPEVERVGCSVGKDLNGRVFITRLLPGSWADKVLLQVGDELVTVHGTDCKETPVEQLEDLLRTIRPVELLIRQIDPPVVPDTVLASSPAHPRDLPETAPPLAPQQARRELRTPGFAKPSVLGSDGALGRRISSSMRSSREGTDTTPRGRSSKINNAKATAALLTLRAAVISRKVPELTRAIDEFVSLGLDGEAVGLNFDDEGAAAELEEARRQLAVLDKKATSHRATTAESRARGKLKKAHDLAVQLDIPVDQKVSALDKAEAAAMEAIELCHLAGLRQAAEGLQRSLDLAQDAWRGAAKARLLAAIKGLEQSEDKAELASALEEGACAGLNLDEATEDEQRAMEQGHAVLLELQRARAVRFSLMEAVHAKNVPEIRKALSNAMSLNVEVQLLLLADAERQLLVAGMRSEAKWMLLAAGIAGEAEDEESVAELPEVAEAWRRRVAALHRASEMGLAEPELEPARALLQQLVPSDDFWQGFRRVGELRLRSQAVSDVEGDERDVAEAKRALAQTKAQQEIEVAIGKRDVEQLRRAIAEARRTAVDAGITKQAVAVLSEEEMITAMDEAFHRGDVETLERAIHAWRAQGLAREELETAEGMLKELRTTAAAARGELDSLLRSPNVIAFENDSPILAAAGRSVLADVAALLKRFPSVALEVHGYFARTKAEVAKELAELRAESVRIPSSSGLEYIAASIR